MSILFLSNRGNDGRRFPRWLAFGIIAFSFGYSSLQATVLYSEDFEAIVSGWSIGSKSSGDTFIGEIAFSEAGETAAAFPTRSLKLSHVAGNGTRIVATMPLQQYSIPVRPEPSALVHTFQFDLRLSRTDVAGYITLFDGATSSQLPMLVEITSDGRFLTGYWNGSANANDFVLLAGYEAETTYTFTFSTNPSAGTYSVSVTGGSASLEEQPYRRVSNGSSPLAQFNSMQIYNDGGMVAGDDYEIYIDNIVIQSIPEARASLLAGIGVMGVALAARWRRGI